MKSTIPAPGPDTSLEARSATLTAALAANLRLRLRAENEAARIAANEPRPGERVPDSSARMHSERAAADDSYGR